MPTTDEVVLAYIGLHGRSQEDVAGRFPEFDMKRLVRAHLVKVISDELGETEAHVLGAFRIRYVLAPRGAEALGVADRPSSA